MRSSQRSRLGSGGLQGSGQPPGRLDRKPVQAPDEKALEDCGDRLSSSSGSGLALVNLGSPFGAVVDHLGTHETLASWTEEFVRSTNEREKDGAAALGTADR